MAEALSVPGDPGEARVVFGGRRASRLRNRLLMIRHGESEANVQGVIVSDPEVGVSSYGLTERGKREAREACDQLKELLHPDHCLPEKLVIVSSDFKRARETAEILHAHLQVKEPIRFEHALRERNFGQFHMTHAANYQKVWDIDVTDPTHTVYGNESVADVVLRTSRLVQSLEDEFQGKIILLISHGDTIKILLTLFLGVPPNEHRTLPYVGNCDIRELKDSQ